MTAPIVAHVHRFIPLPPQRVFDYFVDLRNEPQYNRQVQNIVKTSTGAIGLGTEFQGEHVGFGPVSWRLAEFAAPQHALIEGRVGTWTYRWTADLQPSTGGTVFNGGMEWEPARPWRGLRWLLRLALQFNAWRAFRKMAKVLVSKTVTRSRG